MRKEIFEEGEYYHVYNRGVDKRPVFLDERDYTRFIHTAYILNNFLEIPHRFNIQKLIPKDLLRPLGEPLVEIVAGCLMPNHFHFLLRPMKKDGISRFLHKVGISYTMCFNKLHQRTGRLFESTFKARHIDRHEYASYLTQYIHLNPLDLFQTKSRTQKFEVLEGYPWSSLPDFLGRKSKFSLLLSTSFRDNLLGLNIEEYRQSVLDLV